VTALVITGCGKAEEETNLFNKSEEPAEQKEEQQQNYDQEESTQTEPTATVPEDVDEEIINETETMTNQIVTLKTTKGDIKIELYNEESPITAGNFLKLAKEGYYDGITFHRVIPNFMIQGGDPLSKDDNPANDGTGGPGYAIEDEFIDGLTNVRGTLSMANAGPGTGGSQFFINIEDNTNLDFDKQPLSSKHPVFGKVLEGMDVVDSISLVDKDGRDRPLENVVIENITIE
jgi:peptidylprolyl isomerase